MAEMIERRAGYREIGERVARLETLMEGVREEVSTIKRELDGVAKASDIRGLLDAWNSASGTLKAVKWAAGIGTAVSVILGLIYAAVKAVRHA